MNGLTEVQDVQVTMPVESLCWTQHIETLQPMELHMVGVG